MSALAAARAAAGASTCPYPSPGAAALHLDRNTVQRSHLVKIDDALALARAGEVDRVLVTCPPQVGKTARVGAWAIFWHLAAHPRHHVVAASYNQTLADKIGRSVRSLIELYGAPLGLFLDQSTTAVNYWTLTSGGSLRSVGVGAGLTGFPCDAAFVDDPHKDRAEAESKTSRDAAHDWWSSVLISRLAPGAFVCLIGTRWHPDDLLGRLLREEGRTTSGGRWHVVELPAIATGHPVDPEGNATCDCPPSQPHDALGRAPGEPLSHPKIPITDSAAALAYWRDKQQTSMGRDWAALYQCDPRPTEGALVSLDVLRDRRWFGQAAPPTLVGVALDPSGGGKDNCGLVAGHLGTDNRLWLTDDLSAVMPSDKWGREACLLAYKRRAAVFVVEKNFGGDQARTILRLSWDKLVGEGRVSGLMPLVIEVHAKQNKRIRAEPVAQAFIEDRVRLNAPLYDLEQEWATFQLGTGSSPGALDASVYLVTHLLPDAGVTSTIGTSPAMTAATPPQRAPRSTLARTLMTGGSGGYDPMAHRRDHLRVVPDAEAEPEPEWPAHVLQRAGRR